MSAMRVERGRNAHSHEWRILPLYQPTFGLIQEHEKSGSTCRRVIIYAARHHGEYGEIICSCPQYKTDPLRPTCLEINISGDQHPRRSLPLLSQFLLQLQIAQPLKRGDPFPTHTCSFWVMLSNKLDSSTQAHGQVAPEALSHYAWTSGAVTKAKLPFLPEPGQAPPTEA